MRWPLALPLLLVFGSSASAQSVISVRSGVLNYSEGAVFIDNQLITPKPGKYPTLREGSDLLTQDGRAEIQLMPEVFLRVGMNSGVRMLSSQLADTRIEVLHGSVILDSGNSPADVDVTLVACDSRIRVGKPTRLRVDTDPAQLRIEKGGASVERDGHVTKVAADQLLALSGAPVVRRMNDAGDDALDLWSQQRNRLIFLSLASQTSILDPGTADPLPGGTDLSAWLGYLPPAAVLPLTGSYGAVAVPGYGYYSPWLAMAFYGPVYGGYQMGFAGLGYGGLGFAGFAYRGSAFPGMRGPGGLGVYGLSAPGYRFTPVYPGAVGGFTPRPVGGIRIGVPGPGISLPARGGAGAMRPTAPHGPVHR